MLNATKERAAIASVEIVTLTAECVTLFRQSISSYNDKCWLISCQPGMSLKDQYWDRLSFFFFFNGAVSAILTPIL